MTNDQAKQIRLSFDFSQSEWAKYLKVEVKLIQNYEQGVSKVSKCYASLLTLVDACRDGEKKGSASVLLDWAFEEIKL